MSFFFFQFWQKHTIEQICFAVAHATKDMNRGNKEAWTRPIDTVTRSTVWRSPRGVGISIQLLNWFYCGNSERGCYKYR